MKRRPFIKQLLRVSGGVFVASQLPVFAFNPQAF